MRKSYFFQFIGFFALMFASNGIAQNSYNAINSEENLNSKVYLNSNDIYIFENQIFACLDGQMVPLSFIAHDDQGIYTYITGYQPWHDDDWQCPRGHWNPMYENKCVVCGKSRTPNSPRWGDQ